jgi:diketogulonate reductase-like aldo/keto reductase
MPDRTFLIDGVQVPRFLFGTAWKEDETQRLTELALYQGFRGIDTANQRRHYHEAAVGQAVAASAKCGVVARDELFL